MIFHNSLMHRCNSCYAYAYGGEISAAFKGKHPVTAATFKLRFLLYMCVSMLPDRSWCAEALTTDITAHLAMVTNIVCI